MGAPSFIELDGHSYLWRDVLVARRAQLAAVTKAERLALFELRHDSRPVTDRTAAGRYHEPSLFDCRIAEPPST
jgi:hypothetical protein